MILGIRLGQGHDVLITIWDLEDNDIRRFSVVYIRDSRFYCRSIAPKYNFIDLIKINHSISVTRAIMARHIVYIHIQKGYNVII